MIRDDRPPALGTRAEWSRLEQTLTDARAGFADLSPDEIEDLVNQAVTDTRQSVRRAPDRQRDDE